MQHKFILYVTKITFNSLKCRYNVLKMSLKYILLFANILATQGHPQATRLLTEPTAIHCTRLCHLK
jgi:hypothetical protein